MRISEKKQADVLAMRGKGMSGRAIARVTGISRGAVYDIIKRGNIWLVAKNAPVNDTVDFFEDAAEQTCEACRRKMLIRAGETICLECSIMKGITDGKIRKRKTT